MEYRIYNRPNCSFFDLIAGDRETKQSKGLGLLLAKCPSITNTLIKLIYNRMHNNSLPKYSSYVVDCELSNTIDKSLRADIVIRFYDNCNPILAVVIETKSINNPILSSNVINQVQNYAKNLPQLAPFNNNTLAVALTSFISMHSVSNNMVVHISWMDIIEMLEKSSSKVRWTFEKILIYDYLNFLIKTNKLMNHYSVEVMSIPAGATINGVTNCGIYECPFVNSSGNAQNVGKTNFYNRYSKQIPLYMAFRDKGGEVRTLYKLAGIEFLDIKDQTAINAIDKEGKYTNFDQRISNYLSLYGNVSGLKQVFVLDLDNSISLPCPVRYQNRSPRGLDYRKLNEFFPSSSNPAVLYLQPKNPAMTRKKTP